MNMSKMCKGCCTGKDKLVSKPVIVCSFLFGLVLGFLISPIKHGINIGNDSGNTVNNYDKDKEKEEDAKTQQA